MKPSWILLPSLILSFICFIYNLLLTILFFMNMENGQDQPYCKSCSELCGVWKCMTVAVGESMKNMEMEDIYPFIVATVSVNIVLGVLAMCLLVWGISKHGKKEGQTREEYTI